MRKPLRVMCRASRKSPKNFIKYRADLIIERGIGVVAAKSPMQLASGSPACAASCLIRVPRLASRSYTSPGRNHAGSRHSDMEPCGLGVRLERKLIHDLDAVSKVIRRELRIGVMQPGDRALLARSSAKGVYLAGRDFI